MPGDANGTLHDLLDAVLAEQRRDWTSGKRTPVADLLQQNPVLAADPAQAAQLIYHEFLLEDETGACPSWNALLRSFSNYASLLQLLRRADQLVEEAFPPDDPAQVPTTNLDDYELLEEIGHGGMAVVFKAHKKSLNRIVALKMFRTGKRPSDEERRRFESEAHAVARLQDPNIVQIFDIGEADGQPFLCLEFVEGRSLAQLLGGNPMRPRHAASLIEVLARATHYAHEKGIIHRDLKPANILMQKNSASEVPESTQGNALPSVSPVPWVYSGANSFTPKIADFGLAKFLDADTLQTVSGATMGTPSYMAPEQAEGKGAAVGRQTDVYGLGAILYELLTGRPPFRTDSPLQTLKQVAEADPARPRLLNPAVPRDLETVCLKSLQKEPSRRYATALALADDLRRFVDGKPVQARRIGALGRSWRWCRRNPDLTALATVLMLAIVGGLSGILYQWRLTEVARRDAVAGHQDARQLLSELIQASPVVPLSMDYYPGVPRIEILRRTEEHCRSLLDENPNDQDLRIALTNVYGRLGTLYLQRGQRVEAAGYFGNARSLWDPSVRPGDSTDRAWLATTLGWQAHAALADNDLAEFVRASQSADNLWLELLEEQPENVDFLGKVTLSLIRTIHCAYGQWRVQACKRLFEDNRARLYSQVRGDPANRVLRKRLAYTCLLLGDICRDESSLSEAASHWREAYDQFGTASDSQTGNLLADWLLAFSCWRLMEGKLEDPYYRQGASLLQQTGKRFAALLEQHPDSDWIYDALLENYCTLAACHSKGGRSKEAEHTCTELVHPLVERLVQERADPERALSLAPTLALLASALREAKLDATALPLARQAATLTSRYAALPSRDLGLIDRLASDSLNNSAILNQLKDSAASLHQAEQGRRLYEETYRKAPGVRRRFCLADAWTRIGKARWDLGQADEALAAFRQSATIRRQIFEQAPSVLKNRMELARSYDRLVYWSTLKRDWAGAAAALWEREILWPADAQELMSVSRDFQVLAQQMAHDKHRLSPKEQAEQQHYLDESKRTKQAADAVARKQATWRELLDSLQARDDLLSIHQSLPDACSGPLILQLAG